MKAGAVPRALVVVDLQAPGAQATMLRFLLGSGALDWTGMAGCPWLVLAPPGEGGDRGWCRGTRVLEPAPFFDAESVLALTEQVVTTSNVLIAGLRPPGTALSLGEVNRGFIQTWVQDLLYRERSVVAACQALGLARCWMVSTGSRRARWVAAGVERAGIEVRVMGFPERLRGVEKPPRGHWTIPESLPRADLLLVAESPPMHQMFSAVGNALSAQQQSRSLQISYLSSPPGAPLPTVRDVRMRWVDRPPGGDPREGPIGIPAAGAEVPGDLVPPGVRASLDPLWSRLIDGFLPRQQHWARHVLRVLQQVQPRVLMVGNDRYWAGQTYVRLAKSLGVGTVCLQDGIAAPVPNHTYSTADHVLAAGSLWPRLLDRDDGTARSISVVGQPRYDCALADFRERRHREPAPPRRARDRVLLILQDIHGLDYVRAVLGELLRVDGIRVRIRAHPALRPSGLDRLAGPRARFSSGGSIMDDLAWADLVVTEYSTVAVEALALGLPVLAVTLSGRPPLLDFTVPGQAEGVTERSQIAPAMGRLLAAETLPPAAASQRQVILDELVGPLDDRSASRVAGVVGPLLESGVP